MTTQPYLTQMIHRSAQQHPDRLCVVQGDRRSTGAGFRDRVARLAGALRGLGVGPQVQVAVLAGNSDRVVEAFYALWWAGASLHPLNTRWALAEVAHAVRQAGDRVLLVDDAFLPAVEPLRAVVDAVGLVIHLGDGPSPVGMPRWDDLAVAGPAVEDARRSGDDRALVLNTGGTTGTPKGVELTHTNLVSASLGMLAAGCGTGETYLHVPPLFHVAGVQLMLGHLLGGNGPLVVLPQFSPQAVLEAIQEHAVTDVLLVPTMLQMVLGHPGIERFDLTSLQRIFYGAAPMTPALLAAAATAIPTTGFVQGYGMTETALTIMLPPRYYTPEGREPDRTASIGRPLVTAEVVIRDPEDHEVPRGTVGELTVRSPSVMRGYIGLPEETAAALRGGWMHTGDGAYMDDDGFVHLVDRLKDVIISGGENVYSIEVENVLAAHPAVASVAVIGLPHPTWGEQVHAVVAVVPGATVTVEELVAHARLTLAGFKCPRSIELRDALPTSAAGKIVKAQLRAERRVEQPIG